MRTVITHFHNEAYLLPWWLKHHTQLFDHGILIDHNSTDESCDIIRQYAPHWRLVRSSLATFDSVMTDFEVMSYEQHLPGWKIALNITEFLMPAQDLSLIEAQLLEQGRMGCACTGVICSDLEPENVPSPDLPLLLQKPWGFDENEVHDSELRISMGLAGHEVSRNRFYHSYPIGKYMPGRHKSYHADSHTRLLDLMVFYLLHSPWNDSFVRRKAQISTRVDPDELRIGFGMHHLHTVEDMRRNYEISRQHAADMRRNPMAAMAYARMFGPAGTAAL